MNKLHLKHINCLRTLYLICLIMGIGICNLTFAEDEIKSVNDDHGFKLGGYSSAGISFHNDGETEAALNEISLILTWQNNSRFSFFSELELERPLVWNEDKKFIHDDSYLDSERLYIDYNLSEKINLRAGRFYTYWPLEFTSRCPTGLDCYTPFGNKPLFPVSTNGAMFYGAIPLENQGLEYSVYIETLKDQHRDGDETLFKDVHGARIALNNDFNIGF